QLGGIHIDMNDGACLAEFFDLTRDAIVETHAKGEQQVSAGRDLASNVIDLFEFAADGPIGVGGAVHAEPAQGEGVIFRESAATHDGGGDGDLGALSEFAEFFRGLCADDAAATIKDG